MCDSCVSGMRGKARHVAQLSAESACNLPASGVVRERIETLVHRVLLLLLLRQGQ